MGATSPSGRLLMRSVPNWKETTPAPIFWPSAVPSWLTGQHSHSVLLPITCRRASSATTTTSKSGSGLRPSRARKAGLVIPDVQRLPLERGEVLDGALDCSIALKVADVDPSFFIERVKERHF